MEMQIDIQTDTRRYEGKWDGREVKVFSPIKGADLKKTEVLP